MNVGVIIVFYSRQMPGEPFSQFGSNPGVGQRQQQAGNQQHSQYYQRGVRPQDNNPGNQNSDVREELPRHKRNRQQTSQKLSPQGKRKRKTAQFDNSTVVVGTALSFQST